MSPLRYRDEEPASGLAYLAAGAALGIVAGIVVSQKFGGFSGITSKIRERVERYRTGDDELDDTDEMEEDDVDEALEERVLEAFRNDPILSERAIDIGAIGDGIIELTGWVHAEDEATHAITVARGVPEVETVVNRLDVRDEEQTLRESSRRYEEGEAEPAEGRWEGQQVGTGRRRQGTSAEPDRHADPKPELEDRWLGTEEAIRAAAGETEGITERRRTSKKQSRGDRAGGGAVAPTGVPKADHVAEPDAASDSDRAD